MAGICRGAYLLAMFTGFIGLIRTNGTAGIMGVTGLIGWVTSGELVERVCADGEDGRRGL